MKKLLLAVALFVLPSVANAQCNGVFPNNTVCGNITGSNNTPRATSPSAFLGAAGGTNGQIQYNNAGALGGFTMSGDMTVSTATGVATLNPIANNTLLANISGGALHPTSTTPTGLWDSFCSTSVGQIWVRMSSAWGCNSAGYANPVWWGADPTGAADSSAAFTSAYNTGQCIRWPNGTFKLNSAFAVTLATNTATFCMSGSGQNLTTLNWPNASGGIAITGFAAGSMNLIQVNDIKLTTSQAGGGTAFLMTTGGTVNAPTSYFRNVVIQGDDYAQGSGSHYWNIGYYDHDWAHVILDNVTMNSKWINPLSGAVGIGMQIEGNTGTTSYTQSIKVINSNIGYMASAVVLGSYWQGVLINQTNFSANQCILQAGAATGTLVQLVVANSILYCDFDAIELNTSVIQTQIYGNNIIIINTAGPGGIILKGNERAIIQGNAVVGPGSGTATAGISTQGSYGNIIGNQLSTFGTGVILDTASSQTVAALNTYFNNGTKLFNNGTNNSPGTAAVGNMAGVVP